MILKYNNFNNYLMNYKTIFINYKIKNNNFNNYLMNKKNK